MSTATPRITATVTVTESATPERTIQIKVDPDPINLKNSSPNGEAVDIEWQCDSSPANGWQFTPDGITISANVPQNSFSHVATASRKSTWRRKQGGADRKTYKYDVKLTNGSMTIIVDPGIINEN